MGKGIFMDVVRSWVQKRGYLFAVLCIASATAVFYPGRDYFARQQWALLYLPVIVLVAGTSGSRPALVAAVLSFLAWNYFFLPPYHTLVVADPMDWLSLLVFLLVGITMGMQTVRIRRRELQALMGEREATLLNRFSSYLVTEMNTAGMTDMLLTEIAQSMGANAAALYLSDDEGQFSCAGRSPSLLADSADDIGRLAAWVFDHAEAIGLPAGRSSAGSDLGVWPVSVNHNDIVPGSTRRDLFLPLQTASRVEGVLYVGEKTDGSDYALHDARLLVSIVNQAAAFRERRRLQHAANQAAALKEADRLKSAFMSSISHELKTPLAALTATITSLIEDDVIWDPDAMRAELRAVSEDLDRLNDSIGSLLDLSRLESNAWVPRIEPCEVGDIIGLAVSRIRSKQKERIDFSVPEDLPLISVDFHQWARALENIIENALAYSDPDKPVCIGASHDAAGTRIWVEDLGPGIGPQERTRVFEKFYRGDAARNVASGTGLGLAIAREIVQSHGGSILVEDVQPHGARFVILLPDS